jgi:hypothetical protein
MQFPQCGQQPTALTAKALIERLLRKAEKNPALANDCIAEAIAIEALWKAGELPNGTHWAQPPTGHAPTSGRQTTPRKSRHTQFQLLFFALVGKLPQQLAKTKIPHPTIPGSFYWLGTNGALRVGPTKHQSFPESDHKKQALLAKAQCELARPKAKRTITLSDLKGLL